MSHAYVEVGDVDVAGKILRGEVRDDNSPKNGTRLVAKPRERGSVLGKGRRARGVTITRSSQEELMADVSSLFLYFCCVLRFTWQPLAIPRLTRFFFVLRCSLIGEALSMPHGLPFLD